MTAKIRFIDDSEPGITRRRGGRGWAYFAPDGSRIKDRDEIDRLNKIALPPAYVDAWFCPNPNGHLLATGKDARGRKQYRYHPDFRLTRESLKYDALADFGRALPKVRAQVEADLKRRDLDCERAVACVVRLLDTASLRVGNETYAKSNKSFGATTLRKRHISLAGSRLRMSFKAKSGKQRELTITDRSLIRFVRQMQDLPGQNLFQFLNKDGQPCPVGSASVNDYLASTMGDEFTAKHFRTWAASAIGFEALVTAREPLSLKAMLEQVSDRLGNTPAIARKSYVHPAILALASDKQAQEALKSGLKLPRSTRWLTRYERGLLDFLDAAPDASELLAA